MSEFHLKPKCCLLSAILNISGIYPVHGWKDKEGLVHMAEASSNDNGTVVEWGQMIG